MTAIALVPTPEGIIVAADGLSRWNDAATRDEDAIQNESDCEKKIFKSQLGSNDVVWALSGTIFNKDRSYNLVSIVKRAFHAANNDLQESNLAAWVQLYGKSLHKALSDAKTSGLLAFSENDLFPVDSEDRFTLARIFIAGYFFNSKPAIAIIRLYFTGDSLAEPQPSIYGSPEHTWLLGSRELQKRYLEDHEDKRFKHYYRPYGPTLLQGLDYAKGYIEACSDPLARELDPLCKGIGGHIHSAAITPSGFVWLIKPVAKQA